MVRWGGGLAVLSLVCSACCGGASGGYLTSSAGCGATLPWTRYEAEAGRLSGGATITPRSRERGTFAAVARRVARGFGVRAGRPQ